MATIPTCPSRSDPASSTTRRRCSWWPAWAHSVHGSGTSLLRSLSPWLLLCFAPLWDNLYAGQINTFALLAIALAWRASRRGDERLAGVALAVAIVLKTSPALLLLHFTAARQWRAVAACAATGVVLSGAAALVWRAEYLRTWFDVSMATAASTFDYMNLSVEAFAMRLGGESVGKAVHKVLFVSALLVALRRRGRFERLVVVMAAFSPIVWYHHLVYLLLPIVSALRAAPWCAWSAVALLQLERPVADHVPALASVPTLAGMLLLFCVPFGEPVDAGSAVTARGGAGPAAA